MMMRKKSTSLPSVYIFNSSRGYIINIKFDIAMERKV
uniref:Uncharacterized protein n=1 Tax=Erwinia amylovora ATCC BAA-2158 TaxID=889211 RepID=E5B1G3_ERWAM|nr:hypothetical protein predicted by Glimmer/Critica [Erwinia amylovora ATCC BAA-2158]